jgi:predicted DNA-binding transcriptional regulator AlpA
MEKLLTREDVAEIIGVTPDRFDIIRRQGKGPVEVRLGHRTLRFRPADIDAWLVSRSNAA